MRILGDAFRLSQQPEDALPVLEATLALMRRHWSHDEQGILAVQHNLATCLQDVGRRDEALVLLREGYARRVATLGVSHERTILCGSNLVASMLSLKLWDEAKSFGRDRLLPVARQSLGADHDETLKINHRLAAALANNPERTRDHLRLNQHQSVLARGLISTQATTCSKPRPSCRTWSRGDGGSSARRIRKRVARRSSCPTWRSTRIVPARRTSVILAR